MTLDVTIMWPFFIHLFVTYEAPLVTDIEEEEQVRTRVCLAMEITNPEKLYLLLTWSTSAICGLFIVNLIMIQVGY